MGWRLRWAAAAVAAGAAVAAVAAIVLAAVPVPARAAPGWRIETVLGGRSRPRVQAIAASGADNAWLLGLVPIPGGPDFVIQRWDGSRWVPVTLRLQYGGPWALDSGIYTTSSGDTWVFPVLPENPGGSTVQYALRWDGSAWTASEVTAAPDTVLDAAVFSSTDVWAFGETGSSAGFYTPALVRHWNGAAWQTVPVPVGTPVSVDGVAPGDIWALGVSRATVHRADQAMIVMHWNGTAWSAPSLPALPPARRGYPWVATAITAAGQDDAWVAETPAADSAGYSPGGLLLLHWNGTAWRTVAEDRALGVVTGLTPDGRGGFWLTATDPANPAAGIIADYRDGTFTSLPAPARPGYTGTASGIVAVPGTGSFWAAGTLTPVKGGAYQTVILRYTP